MIAAIEARFGGENKQLARPTGTRAAPSNGDQRGAALPVKSRRGKELLSE